MTGLIIWAGLLIAVLYSPIGSPDLYYSHNEYAVNQSIPVNAGGIVNAPRSGAVSESNDNGQDMPDLSTPSRTSYSVSSTQSSGGASSQGPSYSTQAQSYQNNNSSGSSQNGGGGSFISGGGSRSSAASSGVTMTNGITTLSTTTILGNQTTKQGATATTNSNNGGTDPGGDPTGPPIPVGDGWELFILFGVCYAAFKYRSIILKQLHLHPTKRI